MTKDAFQESWHSDLEIHAQQLTYDLEKLWQETDSKIGREAESIWGELPNNNRSLVNRILYRLVFEKKRLTSYLKRAVCGFPMKLYWNFQNHFYSSKGFIRLSISQQSIEILDEPKSWKQVQQYLLTSEAQFFGFTRNSSIALKRGLQSVDSSIAEHPEKFVFHGNSVNSFGELNWKPRNSKELLFQKNTFGNFIIFHRNFLLGNYELIEPDSQNWLFHLLLSSSSTEIHRIEEVLYREDNARIPHSASDAAELELVNKFSVPQSKTKYKSVFPGHRAPVPEFSSNDLISIVIPTRGDSGQIQGTNRTLVVEAVRSIIEKSTWLNLEIVVVADEITPQKVIDELESIAGEKLTLVRWSETFNFSKKMNRGIALSRGNFLLALNDDVEVVTPDWLEQMMYILTHENVEIVGSLLFFEDMTIQHAGHFYQGGAGHVGINANWVPTSYFDFYALNRPVSGVTAACALFTRETLESVGGFSTRFPNNFNDVDFCLKVRSKNSEIYLAGSARLYHFESKTRTPTVTSTEAIELRRRWANFILEDKFWKKSP